MDECEWCLVIENRERIKEIKTAAESKGIYDKSRLISQTLNDRGYAIPVIAAAFNLLPSSCEISCPPFQGCRLVQSKVCDRNRARGKNSIAQEMKIFLMDLAHKKGFSDSEVKELIGHVPEAWVRHGDMVVFSHNFLEHPLWQRLVLSGEERESGEVWKLLSKVLKCERILLLDKISKDSYRTPVNHLVLGESGWVTHTDNGVHYVFDATRTMFSQGNITEKIRVANLDCKGEVVVDLFAGIGYFTLPLLVHSGAKLVYACEWNPVAIEGLKRGLEANAVAQCCVICQGDNREVAPRGVADRVVLGLIPSSEGSWEVACSCIRQDTGGWLHIHGNVTVAVNGSRDQSDQIRLFDKPAENISSGANLDELEAKSNNSTDHSSALDRATSSWSCYVKTKISAILHQKCDGISLRSLASQNEANWIVSVRHIEHVKSYAPHVYHTVLDVECRPIAS